MAIISLIIKRNDDRSPPPAMNLGHSKYKRVISKRLKFRKYTGTSLKEKKK